MLLEESYNLICCCSWQTGMVMGQNGLGSEQVKLQKKGCFGSERVQGVFLFFFFILKNMISSLIYHWFESVRMGFGSEQVSCRNGFWIITGFSSDLGFGSEGASFGPG